MAWNKRVRKPLCLVMAMASFASLLRLLGIHGEVPPPTDLGRVSASGLTRHQRASTWQLEQPFVTAAQDMSVRVQHMRHVCRSHGLSLPGPDALHRPNPWEYFIEKKHGLVWCNVFKSGSTSWIHIFNQLSGAPNRGRLPPVTLARISYPRPTVSDLLDASRRSISFIVGRHPFERLVSAYRDKIERAFRHSYHDKLGLKIVRRFRGQKPLHGASKARVVPTFVEFVRYVVQEAAAGRPLDMHWTPVYSFCNPCQINFTHIVKMETFDRDQELILRQANLHSVVNRQQQNAAKGGRTSHSLMNKFVHQLPPDLFAQLVQLYRVDFDIFDYPIPELPAPRQIP